MVFGSRWNLLQKSIVSPSPCNGYNQQHGKIHTDLAHKQLDSPPFNSDSSKHFGHRDAVRKAKSVLTKAAILRCPLASCKSLASAQECCESAVRHSWTTLPRKKRAQDVVLAFHVDMGRGKEVSCTGGIPGHGEGERWAGLWESEEQEIGLGPSVCFTS